ncbi:NAD dependent epimerase/dehydratase family protein [Aphelenchoides besseyi]|nr:NAD dependent epimerase/dehydratase family protein [Aphelenchoides besseyi]KAI6210495.1 NAD dependent epimerase/dehydratase family protein [Aphelenchoides besseyi]
MSEDYSQTRVLVTGASGYIASHCVQQLLDLGYTVRGTVRSLKNEVKVQPLRELKNAAERLELQEADLNDADPWLNVVEGCDYVLHVASPFTLDDNETLIPIAVNGTLNVLKACSKASTVKKVVLTSSCAAVNEGHDEEERAFNEEDWTNIESPKVMNYAKSKTAAWDFLKDNEGHQFKLTCLNPTFVIGPLLTNTLGASVTTMKKFLNFEVPGIPPLQMGMVDVRDVARAHILAMQRPETDGERILITTESWWFKKICAVLSEEFKSYLIPFLPVPYPFVWLYSFISVEARASLCRLNRKVVFNNEKSKKLLGLEYRDVRESIISVAYSLIERGLVPKKSGYQGPSKSCDSTE